jgi:hypothetical protein
MDTMGYTIHYLGKATQRFHNTELIDIVWHLGAQYGGSVYNKAIADSVITIDEVNRVVVIRPTIQELVDKSIQELL